MQNSAIPRGPALSRLIARLEEGVPCRLVVTGDSMLPFLRHGQDAVILVPLSGSIRRGELLFYLRAPGIPVLHRVCAIRSDGSLFMCGDAQTTPESISPTQVLARVTMIDKHGVLTDCSAPISRLKARIWIALRPLRPCILAVLRRFETHKKGDIYGKYH